MAIRRLFAGLAIGILILGITSAAVAETLNYKLFNHVMKREVFPIPDAEGHTVVLTLREGVSIFENGELAWVNVVATSDMIKGAGTLEQYVTMTFQDGSIIVTHTKGTIQAAPAGVPPPAKWTGEIIHGTGRFQGVKGTQTTSSKLLRPEKGELGPKSLGEGTLNYTLPSK